MNKKTRQKLPNVTQWELGFLKFSLLILVLGWVVLSTVDQTLPGDSEVESDLQVKSDHSSVEENLESADGAADDDGADDDTSASD